MLWVFLAEFGDLLGMIVCVPVKGPALRITRIDAAETSVFLLPVLDVIEPSDAFGIIDKSAIIAQVLYLLFKRDKRLSLGRIGWET